MEPLTRVKNCINWIISRFPFYSTILIELEIKLDSSIETACTNGKYIGFNPGFVDQLKRNELIFLVLHETAHIMFKHHLRMLDKNPDLWNRATDYVINNWLKNQGFELIDGILYEPDFDGFSEEKIYNILSEQKQNEPQTGDKNKPANGEPEPKTGKFESLPTNNPDEIKQAENTIDSKIQQSEIISELAGNENGFLRNWIKERRETRLNWNELLQDSFQETACNDYTFSVPNRRFLNSGLYLPSLRNKEQSKNAIFVDCSASIRLDLFNELISEIQTAKANGAIFDLFLFDVQVYNRFYDFTGDENLEISFGGTDFSCIKSEIEKSETVYNKVFILTDGKGIINFTLENSTWIIYENPGFDLPNCKVLHVRE